MTSATPFRFPPDYRLRKRADFLRVQRIGRRTTSRYFTFLLARRPAAQPSASAPSRVGIVVTKKIGTAVVRNRLKRLCRECFRRFPGLVPEGLDVVVILRAGSGSAGLKLADVRAEWLALERRLRKQAYETLASAEPQRHVSGQSRGGPRDP